MPRNVAIDAPPLRMAGGAPVVTTEGKDNNTDAALRVRMAGGAPVVSKSQMRPRSNNTINEGLIDVGKRRFAKHISVEQIATMSHRKADGAPVVATVGEDQGTRDAPPPRMACGTHVIESGGK